MSFCILLAGSVLGGFLLGVGMSSAIWFYMWARAERIRQYWARMERESKDLARILDAERADY